MKVTCGSVTPAQGGGSVSGPLAAQVESLPDGAFDEDPDEVLHGRVRECRGRFVDRSTHDVRVDAVG